MWMPGPAVAAAPSSLLFKLSISLEGGKEEVLAVFEGDDPSEVARRFVAVHGLPDAAVPQLAASIVANMQSRGVPVYEAPQPPQQQPVYRPEHVAPRPHTPHRHRPQEVHNASYYNAPQSPASASRRRHSLHQVQPAPQHVLAGESRWESSLRGVRRSPSASSRRPSPSPSVRSRATPLNTSLSMSYGSGYYYPEEVTARSPAAARRAPVVTQFVRAPPPPTVIPQPRRSTTPMRPRTTSSSDYERTYAPATPSGRWCTTPSGSSRMSAGNVWHNSLRAETPSRAPPARSFVTPPFPHPAAATAPYAAAPATPSGYASRPRSTTPSSVAYMRSLAAAAQAHSAAAKAAHAAAEVHSRPGYSTVPHSQPLPLAAQWQPSAVPQTYPPAAARMANPHRTTSPPRFDFHAPSGAAPHGMDSDDDKGDGDHALESPSRSVAGSGSGSSSTRHSDRDCNPAGNTGSSPCHQPALSPSQRSVTAVDFLKQYQGGMETHGDVQDEKQPAYHVVPVDDYAQSWRHASSDAAPPKYIPKPVVPPASTTYRLPSPATVSIHGLMQPITLEEVAASRGCTPMSMATNVPKEAAGPAPDRAESTTSFARRLSTTSTTSSTSSGGGHLSSQLQALIDRKRELMGNFRQGSHAQARA